MTNKNTHFTVNVKRPLFKGLTTLLDIEQNSIQSVPFSSFTALLHKACLKTNTKSRIYFTWKNMDNVMFAIQYFCNICRKEAFNSLRLSHCN